MLFPAAVEVYEGLDRGTLAAQVTTWGYCVCVCVCVCGMRVKMGVQEEWGWSFLFWEDIKLFWNCQLSVILPEGRTYDFSSSLHDHIYLKDYTHVFPFTANSMLHIIQPFFTACHVCSPSSIFLCLKMLVHGEKNADYCQSCVIVAWKQHQNNWKLFPKASSCGGFKWRWDFFNKDWWVYNNPIWCFWK